MKIYAISDLHLSISGAKPMEIFGGDWQNYLQKIQTDWNKKVSNDDIVLCSGDTSWGMKLEEAEKDFDFFDKLNGKKILVRGNHDYWWQSISSVRNMLPYGCYALQNDALKFGDYVVCGTRGWIVPDENGFNNVDDEKIYKRELIRLEMALDSAKRLADQNDKIICMLHYPPYNANKQYNQIIELLKKYNVKVCVFGHIHSHKGKYNLIENLYDIDFYLTSCDLIKNKLVEINL